MATYQLAEKIWAFNDTYYIKTLKGRSTFQITSEFFSWGNNLSFRDMAGKEVLQIKEKIGLSIKYEILRRKKSVASLTKTGWFFDRTMSWISLDRMTTQLRENSLSKNMILCVKINWLLESQKKEVSSKYEKRK